MSSREKVKLSEIVENAGLSGRRALRIMGLPFCNLLHIQNQTPGTEVEINVFTENENKSYISAGSAIQIKPVFPVESYIEANGTYEVVFRYQGTEDQVRLVFTNQLSVPMPPGWPEPNFLQAKYPVA